ncbi:hypothetical protein JCM15519_02450 [Fundidesulfovibrio butyratiphilus]
MTQHLETNWKTVSRVPTSLKLPEVFVNALAPGARVLDAGCGDCLAEAELHGLGARYVGLDCNGPSLARARGRGLVVVAGQGQNLPFAVDAFDAVVFRAVFTVLPNLEACARAMAEALRVAGLVCVADFLQTWDNPVHAERYRRDEAATGERGAFFVREEGKVLFRARHFTEEELHGLVRQAGGTVRAMLTPNVFTRTGKPIRGVYLLAERA